MNIRTQNARKSSVTLMLNRVLGRVLSKGNIYLPGHKYKEGQSVHPYSCMCHLLNTLLTSPKHSIQEVSINTLLIHSKSNNHIFNEINKGINKE